LVVAGKRFFAEAIRAILEQEGLTVAGVVTRSADAVQAAVEHAPDVVLMDIDPPEMEALQAGRRILTYCHRTRLVGLVTEGSVAVLRSATEAGFVGFLPKESTPRDLVQTMRAAAAGDPVAPPEYRQPGPRRPGSTVLASLTPRERQVLCRVIEGSTSREIGHQLGISENTVRTHIHSVLAKLGVGSRVEAAALALRHGMRETS
jgi:two-component system nitrate/nitrite response regulator NarL